MSIPFWERNKYIDELYEYEEENDIPEDERLTYNPYADNPEILGAAAGKKPYVDIRSVIGKVKDLKDMGKIK